MTSETLIVEQQDGWMTVWFNRPEVRNALSNDVIEELTDLLSAVRDDRSVRGISLRGKGGTFCAGGDIKDFKSVFQGGSTHADIASASSKGGELFHLLNAMPQVVIILVEGAAIAGGLGILCTGGRRRRDPRCQIRDHGNIHRHPAGSDRPLRCAPGRTLHGAQADAHRCPF